MNSAAFHTGVQISVQVPAVNYLGYIPRSERNCWIIWYISTILKCVSKETDEIIMVGEFFNKMKNTACFVPELSFT